MQSRTSRLDSRKPRHGRGWFPWLATPPRLRHSFAGLLVLLLVSCDNGNDTPAPEARSEAPTQRVWLVSGNPMSDAFAGAFGGEAQTFTLAADSDTELSTQADALAAMLRNTAGGNVSLSVVATASGRRTALLAIARSGLRVDHFVLLNTPDDFEVPTPLVGQIGEADLITAARPGHDADIIVGSGFSYVHPAVGKRVAGVLRGEPWGTPLILTGQPTGPGWQLTRVALQLDDADERGWLGIDDWEGAIGDEMAWTPNLNVPAGRSIAVTSHRVRRLLPDAEIATSTIDVGEEKPPTELTGDGWSVTLQWQPVEFR